MLMLINLTLTLLFLFLNHPMTMGLVLLLQTMLISLITGLLNSNFWFSYILFLIMIGGLLVLFIYMTSIASNEMFSYSSKMFIMFLIFFMMSLIMIMIMDPYFINMNFIYNESWINTTNMNLSLIKYFNYPSTVMIFFMVIYLFITLIAVVKITKIEYGPLRQKF
uniref:NADH-ubiquinone oxidoreductase chain 6 n=1 Tax=Dacrila fallax TaxID=877962 RepID=A0A0S2M735_9COLE|nr:NADH dehydrogenase subunit 6 [Dacrila fallax]ALO70500.1 NADH deshydrogenase subunit 6 [Dacrila fallax]